VHEDGKDMGIQGPRTAILLPLWQEIFDELQLEPHYILAVRHPGTVAASLSRRNRLAFAHSQALWLKTNLDVLSHAGNDLRAIVDYDRWFESGLQQARTVVNSSDLSDSMSETPIAEALNQVIHPGLRHHSDNEDMICSRTMAKFYSLLARAAVDGKISDEISEITATFEKSLDLLNIWDDLVAERDAVIAEGDLAIAGHNLTIADLNLAIEQKDQEIARYKRRWEKYKRRLIVSYAILLILVIIYIACRVLIYCEIRSVRINSSTPSARVREFLFYPETF
jgi:hypothetical protein